MTLGSGPPEEGTRIGGGGIDYALFVEFVPVSLSLSLQKHPDRYYASLAEHGQAPLPDHMTDVTDVKLSASDGSLQATLQGTCCAAGRRWRVEARGGGREGELPLTSGCLGSREGGTLRHGSDMYFPTRPYDSSGELT